PRTAFRQVDVGSRPLSLPSIKAALGRVFYVSVIQRENFTRSVRNARQCVERCRAKVGRALGLEHGFARLVSQRTVQYPNRDVGPAEEHELKLRHRHRVLKGERLLTGRYHERASLL